MSPLVATKANTRSFAAPKFFAAWLKKNHATVPELWIRHYKKASGIPSIHYAQAVDEALCWGWIDGQKQSYDAQSWLQRYVPRRPKSHWSKLNRDHVARLEKEGRMRPQGRVHVEAAKADGRWDAAYAGQKDAKVPADFIKALAKDKQALAFFKSLSKANHFAIYWRLHSAKKPETRARRFAILLEMMRAGRKLH